MDRGQICLLGLNDVLAFVGLLAPKVDGVLEETESAVLVGPVVLAMTVIGGEDSPRGGNDLGSGLDPALGDAALQSVDLDNDLLKRQLV